MLSAVIEQLHSLRDPDFPKDRRLQVIDYCTSAYPDVRPWQVRRACVESTAGNDEISSLFYTYLSALLHPIDGHDSARNDKQLVKEWCELSTIDPLDQRRWRNFMCVASRSSSDHLAYFRDLPFLLKLASLANDDHLVFDLCK